MEVVDKSAVSYLLLLEKGLSSKGGEKISAILEFPRIVEKYSFPSFVKSCFQKLSQCFLNGTNTERLYIVQTIENCQKNFSTITGFGSIVDNFYQVVYKNDPFSRITAIRAFKALAPCLQSKNMEENINFENYQLDFNTTAKGAYLDDANAITTFKQHNNMLTSRPIATHNNVSSNDNDDDDVAYFKIMNTIIDSLDSTNEDELFVAIDAATTFSKISSQFSKLLVPKVNQILLTTNNSKLVDRFIMLYSAISYHIDSAHMAYECCYQLFCSFPYRSLSVMTTICSRCSSLVNRHVEFLMDMISSKEMSKDTALKVYATCQLAKIGQFYPQFFGNIIFLKQLWNLLFSEEQILLLQHLSQGPSSLLYAVVFWTHLVRNNVIGADTIFIENIHLLITAVIKYEKQYSFNTFVVDLLILTAYINKSTDFDSQCVCSLKRLFLLTTKLNTQPTYNIQYQLCINIYYQLFPKLTIPLKKTLLEFIFNLCLSSKCALPYLSKMLRKLHEQLPLSDINQKTLVNAAFKKDSYSEKLLLLNLLYMGFNRNSNTFHPVFLTKVLSICLDEPYSVIYTPSPEESCDEAFYCTQEIVKKENNIKALALLGLECLFKGHTLDSCYYFYSLINRNDISTNVKEVLWFFFHVAKCESLAEFCHENYKKLLVDLFPDTTIITLINLASRLFTDILASNMFGMNKYYDQRSFQKLFLVVRIDLLNLAKFWIEHRNFSTAKLCNSSIVTRNNFITKCTLSKVSDIIKKWSQLQYLTIDADMDSHTFFRFIYHVLNLLFHSFVNMSESSQEFEWNVKPFNKLEMPSNLTHLFHPFLMAIQNQSDPFIIIDTIVSEVILKGWPIPKFFFHAHNLTSAFLNVSHDSSLSDESVVSIKKNVHLVISIEGVIKNVRNYTMNNLDRVVLKVKSLPVIKNGFNSNLPQTPLTIHCVTTAINKNYFEVEIQTKLNYCGLFCVYAEIEHVIDSKDRTWSIPNSCTKLMVQVQ